MQSVDEKDQRIKQLENENKKLQEKTDRLEHNVEALTQAVLHASKQRFGAFSEKTPPTEGQASLFGEERTDNLPLPYAPVIHIREHKRPVRKKGHREKLTEGLARESVECVLNPEESACGICGSELKVIGKKKVRSEMEYIDAIYSAPVPAPVLTHSIASPSSAAWIMYQKYVLSVPLYRQERDFQRMGTALKRAKASPASSGIFFVSSRHVECVVLMSRVKLMLLGYWVYWVTSIVPTRPEVPKCVRGNISRAIKRTEK